MAGIAKNANSSVVSNSSESVLELSFPTDTTSLQELIESELAMRDPTNTINKTSSSSKSSHVTSTSSTITSITTVTNSVCASDANTIKVPNANMAHDTSPSSKFDEIFRETFQEDGDVEDTYTNTPEILSPQMTSSTEFLDMSYSMKFEKLLQQETYVNHKQAIIPLSQNNREDIEIDSLDNCQEIIRLKSSIQAKDPPPLVATAPHPNGDISGAQTNGAANDYEEINFDTVKMKNAYNEKFLHADEPEVVEYEEISKFNMTNMFIENEIYHNRRDAGAVSGGREPMSVHVNGVMDKERSSESGDDTGLDDSSKSKSRELVNTYENVQVEPLVPQNQNHPPQQTPSQPDADLFESISDQDQTDDGVVTAATNYDVKVHSAKAANVEVVEHIYESPQRKLSVPTGGATSDAELVTYENMSAKNTADEEIKSEPLEEPEGVDFDEFDPTVSNSANVNKILPSFPNTLVHESPSPNAAVSKNESMKETTAPVISAATSKPSSPQIVGVSSKNQFVEPTEQLVFESWTTPDAASEESRIVIIEKNDVSTESEDNAQEVRSESFESSEKKTAKKKKNGITEETTVTTSKVKKSKKSKKSDEKENHISVITTTTSTTSHMEEDDLSNVCVRDLKQTYVSEASKNARNIAPEEPVPASIPIKELKSSFSKFDELSKKALASSMTDVPRTLQNGGSSSDVSGSGLSAPPAMCKSCGKTVFVMEQIKAEKQIWHKNCFRCKECNKQLTLDIYSSHEGVLYCKPHFRELFKPKAVVENQDPEPSIRRKPELIIRENQPVELPPDVIRASDKPDLGLEELSSLNVKSRYQVFEKSNSGDEKTSPSGPVNVKRSPSILSKLAKFQAKGMSMGVSDENLNGVHYEESETSSEEEQDSDGDQSRDKIIKNKKKRERPLSFSKMEDVKKSWENGPMSKEERLEERKLEKQNLRSRLFMGKQGKMKEMYEQAVADSEKGIKREVDIQSSDKAKNMRDKFERGDVNEDGEESSKNNNKSAIEEDLSVFEAGISKKSRSLFLELDANAAKTVTTTPPPHTSPRSPRFDESRRASREGESPERDVYRDPNIVRADDQIEDESVVIKNATASKMLSIFRQMEEQAAKETVPDGPKPLKSFTPPPDYKGHSGDTESEPEESEEEEEEEEESEEEVVRGSYKVEDEFLKQAANAARAKALAAKFEHWEPEKQSSNNAINMLDSEQASLDSTKSLRARFESLNNSEQTKEKARPKVNRFVAQSDTPSSTLCYACNKKVYPLEKIETDGKLFHRACFRCTRCCTILRMESYTMNNGHLYCLPHFKQLFISKGNYDEGFGTDQHKRKWQPVAATAN